MACMGMRLRPTQLLIYSQDVLTIYKCICLSVVCLASSNEFEGLVLLRGWVVVYVHMVILNYVRPPGVPQQ